MKRPYNDGAVGRSPAYRAARLGLDVSINQRLCAV